MFLMAIGSQHTFGEEPLLVTPLHLISQLFVVFIQAMGTPTRTGDAGERRELGTCI